MPWRTSITFTVLLVILFTDMSLLVFLIPQCKAESKSLHHKWYYHSSNNLLQGIGNQPLMTFNYKEYKFGIMHLRFLFIHVSYLGYVLTQYQTSFFTKTKCTSLSLQASLLFLLTFKGITFSSRYLPEHKDRRLWSIGGQRDSPILWTH